MAAEEGQVIVAAEEGQVIDCHTLQAWTDQLDKAKESKKLIVVDFTASWCGPSRIMAPILAELAKKITNVIFLKVDVDELGSVAEEYGVKATPTFIFIKDGKVVHNIVGTKKDELNQTVVQFAAVEAAASTA